MKFCIAHNPATGTFILGNSIHVVTLAAIPNFKKGSTDFNVWRNHTAEKRGFKKYPVHGWNFYVEGSPEFDTLFFSIEQMELTA